jgi:hypothetical protein
VPSDEISDTVTVVVLESFKVEAVKSRQKAGTAINKTNNNVNNNLLIKISPQKNVQKKVPAPTK